VAPYPWAYGPLSTRRRAQKKGISKYKFAKLLGVESYSVFRYFRTGYDPKLSTLTKWARVLGVRVRDLIKE
jgi:transcriptional regulator with XRE-family HTH domain